jgi:hypothetical protein
LWAGWEGLISDHYQNYHLSICYVDKILLSSDLARVDVGAFSNFELTAKIKKTNLRIFICLQKSNISSFEEQNYYLLGFLEETLRFFKVGYYNNIAILNQFIS